MVRDGIDGGYLPVVGAYNLMFDLQTVIYELSKRYGMECSAQSTTHVYTLDLIGADGDPVLRFWDMFYLDMRGLSAMGDVCGVPKLDGSWDYALSRTPDTPLTEEELSYASRDVEVLACYCSWLCDSYEWLGQSMLGSSVLTKTSLVRQMAKRDIGNMRQPGKRRSIGYLFRRLCEQEFPGSFYQYALRKSCFRGGYTFTSALYSGDVQRRVASYDVTSMHHAFINGMRVPVMFRAVAPRELADACRAVVSTPVENVLRNYAQPFQCALHAAVAFRNIRLRRGSVFADQHIGLLNEAKFRNAAQKGDWVDDAEDASTTALRASGWRDECWDGRFAFGKLMSARRVVVHVSEVELYAMSIAYEWDSMEALHGEVSVNFDAPPDYVTLQSNVLFDAKQEVKSLTKAYDGSPCNVPCHALPSNMQAMVREGTLQVSELESYYSNVVKGMLNGIFGTQAQDVLKPGFVVDGGSVAVDSKSVPTPSNFDAIADSVRGKPVLYTYGMRIVGRSRLHLVLAMQLVHKAFPEMRILGGDTDSLKIALEGRDPGDALRALAPLHSAVTESIAECMSRVRSAFPDKSSALDGAGCFELESVADEHMEMWPKARVYRIGNDAHLTCAGLSRPKGAYTVEDAVSDSASFAEGARELFGWNVTYAPELSHSLGRTHPAPQDRVNMDVEDYMGRTAHVDAPEAVCLYPSERAVGDTLAGSNMRSVSYMREIGRDVYDVPRYVSLEGGVAVAREA